MNEIIRKSKRHKEVYLNDICNELELKTNNLNKASGMVTKFFGGVKKNSSGIREENWELLDEEKEVTNSWKQYLANLHRINQWVKPPWKM